jgi:hypothetical protein
MQQIVHEYVQNCAKNSVKRNAAHKIAHFFEQFGFKGSRKLVWKRFVQKKSKKT